jgi:NAD(P)-dependent dehydrogenase (short-subunit alcohol dehydrogenase family)
MYDVSGSLPVNVCVGLLLILAGRRLFWFYVGVIGLLAGLEFAQAFLADSEQWTRLAGSIVFGMLGAALAVLSQWGAVVLVGILGGGYLFMHVFEIRTIASQADLLVVAAGGVFGMVAMLLTFDWALIIMTALTGSFIVAHAFAPDRQPVVIVVGTLLGMFIQAVTLKKKPGR